MFRKACFDVSLFTLPLKIKADKRISDGPWKNGSGMFCQLNVLKTRGWISQKNKVYNLCLLSLQFLMRPVCLHKLATALE